MPFSLGLGWLAGGFDDGYDLDEEQKLTPEEEDHLKRILGYDEERKVEDEVSVFH